MAKEEIFHIRVTGAKEILLIQEQIKRLKNDLKATNDATVIDKLSKELIELEANLKTARREQKNAVAAFETTNKGTGAYQQLNAQLRISNERMRDLLASGKGNTAEFAKLSKETGQLRNRLVAIDASVGNFQRNVGNYAGTLKGLFGQLQNSLKSTLLVGQIRNVPQLLNAAIGAYQKIVEVIDQYRDATDAAYAVNKKINTAIDENIAEYAKETIALQTVFETAEKTTVGTEEHNVAIKAINETYGQYLPNLLTENSTLEEIDKAQQAATDALIKNTVAKIQNATATEIVTNLFKEQLKVQRAETARSQGGFVNFFNELNGNNALAIDLLEKNVQKTTDEFGLVEKAGEGITKILQDLSKNDVSFFKLLGGGSTDGEKKVIAAAKSAAEKASETIRKEADKENERVKKARADFLKDEVNFLNDQAKIYTDIRGQISQAVVSNIEDEGLRSIAQEKLNFELLQAQQAAQFAEIVAKLEAQEAKIIELFGENSAKVLEFREATYSQLASLEAQFATLNENANIAHQNRLKEIEAKGAAERTAQEKLDNDLRLQLEADYQAEMERNFQLQLSKLAESLAKGEVTIEESNAKKFDIERQFLQERIELISKSLAMETSLTEAERQNLVLERQKLNTDLAQLEEAQTAKVIEESEKQEDKRRAAITSALNSASQVLGEIDKLVETLNNRAAARFDAQIEERQKVIDGYEKQLEDADGIEAEFLQGRIDNEKKAQEELLDAQKRALKETAAAKKAFALGQAAINVALGITAAFELPPPASFVAAALTGVLGAIQIATIAAQPLATGGVVGTHINGQPVKRSNGDNVLTTLKTGEAVLNENQQRKVGYHNLAIAGVPGFAGGGLVGAPSINSVNSPNIQQIRSDFNAASIIRQTVESIAAIPVVYNQNTQRSVNSANVENREIRQQNRLRR